MADPTLNTVLQAISDLRTEVTGLRSDVTARIDRLEQGQTRLRVELSARLDRVQTGQDALRQGYIVDWANVDRVARTAHNASDETRALGEQLMQLTKLVHMLEAQIRDLRGDG
jgi:phage shock protein A